MLAQLVAKAQKAPRKSIERGKILTQLICTIQKSELLSHLDKSQFPEGLYEDAMQKLLQEVCWNIDLYDPANGAVTSWVQSKFAKFLNVELGV
ncbi:MAG: hypothetical protein F6K35_21730 [Okeania sp. SIO2H7]|nr:hypothetical protein [Okeania sp. SIO2H7]